MMLGEDALDALLAREWLTWIGEAFGASGFGVSGTALVFVFLGALGLFNWTESFKVPAVWLSIMTPVVAVSLPVPVVWRLIGIVATAVAFLFVGLWIYWQRM